MDELYTAANRLREANGGVWGDAPGQPVEDWQIEVQNGDTRLGYWEWAAHNDELENG